MKPNTLCREDFHGDPISLDEIVPGLWLGNLSAAIDVETLTSTGITHILTVDSCPLPDHILKNPSLITRFVQLIDVAKADLLADLEACVDFIASALNDSGTVLVHCFFGVSRSAAVAIAFLMHKNRLDYKEAFEIVKSKRPAIGPNAGFVQQLMLYQHMNYSVDAEHQLYKVYRLRLASVDIQKHLSDPIDYAHLIRPDPALIAVHPEGVRHFRCRKCSRTLATDANHLPHSMHSTDADNPSCAYDEHNGLLADIFPSAGQFGGAERRPVTRRICTDSIFVEPLAWMTGVDVEREGRLHCPKCQTKVGSFDWAQAGHCPCGVLVAPAFYMVPSKVELRKLAKPRN